VRGIDAAQIADAMDGASGLQIPVDDAALAFK
jgi:hypothetical protein